MRWRSNGDEIACDEGRLPAEPGMTNNVAEFRALIEGLRYVVINHNDPDWKLEVRGDSKLVIEIMARNWKAKKLHLQKLRSEADNLVSRFGRNRIRWRWVPREQNTECDALSKGIRIIPAPGPNPAIPTRTDFVRAFDCWA